MPIITPLETNARTLSRPNTDTPARWERVGTKPPARLQLLREDSCVIKDSAFRAKYANIFEKQTTFLSWTWRIYGIQYVKVDIRTNKPLNAHFRFRLSFSVSLMDWQQTRLGDMGHIGFRDKTVFGTLSWGPEGAEPGTGHIATIKRDALCLGVTLSCQQVCFRTQKAAIWMGPPYT